MSNCQKERYIWKFCQRLDSNHRSRVRASIALPTAPQPRPSTQIIVKEKKNYVFREKRFEFQWRNKTPRPYSKNFLSLKSKEEEEKEIEPDFDFKELFSMIKVKSDLKEISFFQHWASTFPVKFLPSFFRLLLKWANDGKFKIWQCW